MVFPVHIPQNARLLTINGLYMLLDFYLFIHFKDEDVFLYGAILLDYAIMIFVIVHFLITSAFRQNSIVAASTPSNLTIAAICWRIKPFIIAMNIFEEYYNPLHISICPLNIGSNSNAG